MDGGRPKMREKAEQLALALLTEPSQQAAAAKAGVSDTTVTRWLGNSRFQAIYSRVRRQVTERAVARLARVATKAVDALDRLLESDNEKTGLNAATAVLTLLVKVQGQDVADVLAEIKSMLPGRETGL